MIQSERASNLTIRMLRLGAPVALGRLGVVGMGVVDAVVVGQLAPTELAHQALGWSLNGPALLGGIGLLFGVQVLTARAVGAGRAVEAAQVWRRGLLIAVVAGGLVCAAYWSVALRALIAVGIEPSLAKAGTAVGSVLTLSIPMHLLFMASTQFLEALQRPTPGAIAIWAANGINLACNLVLVPQWGAVGSAWATVISRVFLAAAMIGFIRGAPSLRRLHAARTTTSDVGYGALLSIGVAAAVSAVVEAGAFSAMGVIAGRIDGTSIATFSIATGGLVTLVYLLAQGLATAGAVLSSAAIGADALRDAQRVGSRALGLTLIAMTLCGFVCFVFSNGVARAFSADAAIVATFVANMGFVALLMIPDGGQGVADALLRARGENWWPTIARLVPFLFIAPPLALYLSEQKGYGVSGVFEALLLASLIAFALLWLRLRTSAPRVQVTQ
jgi:MATE family multidrug resistance protein